MQLIFFLLFFHSGFFLPMEIISGFATWFCLNIIREPRGSGGSFGISLVVEFTHNTHKLTDTWLLANGGCIRGYFCGVCIGFCWLQLCILPSLPKGVPRTPFTPGWPGRSPACSPTTWPEPPSAVATRLQGMMHFRMSSAFWMTSQGMRPLLWSIFFLCVKAHAGSLVVFSNHSKTDP